jgi:putative transposase
MCRVLQVSRAAFYGFVADPSRGPVNEALLATHIRAIHRRSRETYGSPRIRAELREQGLRVSRKRVARLMKESGLEGLPRKKRFKVATTDSDHDDPIAANRLDRNFEAEAPNQVWVGDITYLRCRTGFAYLAVLIDLHSRRVVGWAVADHMRTELVQEAFQRAIALRDPSPGLVHHTDRGSQYASMSW